MHAIAKKPPRFTPSLDDELLFHEIKKVSRSEMRPGSPPECTKAVLTCYACNGFTKHEYIGRRFVLDNAGNRLYSELMYSCLCGKERVWGTETIPEENEKSRSKT